MSELNTPQPDTTSVTTNTRPALLALDWGTSSLRAFLLDATGQVLDTRASAHGIQNLPQPGEAGFRQAFADIASGWLDAHPGLPAVAGGMVGSAQGWREAPYVSCPADLQTLAAHAAQVDTGRPGTTLLIAPGLIHRPVGAAPDVLRGEEIQIAGALAHHPEWSAHACMVLPGTHSKWVEVRGGSVQRFVTHMTGELFAALARHTILGRLFPEAPASAAEARQGFELGVAAARKAGPGDLGHQLFAVRTLGLTKQLPPGALPEYLSGLLIGHELVSGIGRLGGTGTATPLLLIGDPKLCQRYVQALTLLNRPPAAVLDNTAPAGLLDFARAAGLLRATPEESPT
ncbi:MAG: 2-dehydro-3-deoxygalactonokinase [Moraxellaceae bacterium]|nr:2-dehydro-3-deoxygalactonokinase [Moraxellaceae bacterium]